MLAMAGLESALTVAWSRPGVAACSARMSVERNGGMNGILDITGTIKYNATMKETLKCPVCHEEFKVKLSHKEQRKYCSRECMAKAYQERLRGESNPHWRGGKIEKICQECGKTFLVTPARVDTSKFCSRKCLASFQRGKPRQKKSTFQRPSRQKQNNKIEKQCLNCLKKFTTRKDRPSKYCSKKCYAEALSTKPKKCVVCGGKTKNKKYCSKECKIKDHRKEKHCPTCSKKFTIPKSKVQKYCSYKCNPRAKPVTDKPKMEKRCPICFCKFETYKSQPHKHCSRECFNKATSIRQRGKKSNLWKGGKTKRSRYVRAHKLYAQWRKKILKRDDYTCQSCLRSFSEVKNGTLHAHHIIPFAENKRKALKVSNGITLCKNCHEELHSCLNSEEFEEKEKTLQKKAIKFLEEQPGTHCLNIHGSALQRAGEPDLLCCVAGRTLAIELKKWPKFPTPLQKHRMKEWRDAGAATFVCRTLKEVARCVEIIKQSQEE
jgi:5-methylcytosine-specific restriction endonuclease McrA